MNLYKCVALFRSNDLNSTNSVEIVIERLAQSIHAAIISDTIFGNKRKK